MSKKDKARRILKRLEANKPTIGKIIPDKETEIFILLKLRARKVPEFELF